MNNKFLILANASFVDEDGNFVFAPAEVYVSGEFLNAQNAILQSFGMATHEVLRMPDVEIEDEE